jgi:hypothetical protein
MFAIIFFALVGMAILNICSVLVMRIRLARRAPITKGKFAWWGSGSDEVSAAYQRAFPGSFLPLFIRLTFWLLIAVALILLIKILAK